MYPADYSQNNLTLAGAVAMGAVGTDDVRGHLCT
jgi:hypothetical protein